MELFATKELRRAAALVERQKMYARNKEEPGRAGTYCAICGRWASFGLGAWTHEWFGMEAHVWCMSKQPMYLFAEGYALNMETYDLPHDCNLCKMPIVKPEVLRRYYGCSLHGWCLRPWMEVELKRFHPKAKTLNARTVKDWFYWEPILRIPHDWRLAVDELMIEVIHVEMDRRKKEREDQEWAEQKRRWRHEGTFETLEKSPRSIDFSPALVEAR